MTRVLIDFRLSMTVNLNILFFHLVNNIFACPHGKGEYGPGNIFISLGNKRAAVHAKKIFTIVRLAAFI